MVSEEERPRDEIPRSVPRDFFLVHKHAHQFGDGEGRVSLHVQKELAFPLMDGGGGREGTYVVQLDGYVYEGRSKGVSGRGKREGKT